MEYGYYTLEAPPSGHGAGYSTFHNFKDARNDDEVKNEIYSLLDEAKIWESDDAEDETTEPTQKNTGLKKR